MMIEPKDSVGGFSVQPPVDLRGVADAVWSKFRDAQSFKRPYAKDWPKYYMLYSGRHWDGRQPEWMSTPVINLTFSVIQTILPILTDSRPSLYVLPRKPEMEQTATTLGHVLSWLWEQNDLDEKLPKTILNTLIFGNGFLKVTWNPDLRDGLGDIQVVEVDPSHIFISPFARTLEEADYIIHAENLPKSLVKRMFGSGDEPELSGPEAPELTLDRSITSSGSKGGIDYIRATDGSRVDAVRGPSEQGSSDQNDKLVTVLEIWERKDDGTVAQTVVANDKVILGPKASPFSHGRFPFVHFVDHPASWSVWAMGEVQQIEKLQIEINKRRGHIHDILRYTASPMLVVDPASGISYDDIVARPGLVLPVEGGPQSVGWLQPPAVHPALFEVNEADKRDFDIVLGNVDVMQGRRPEGIEAGVAIEMLQEAANVRMRLKVRYMENSIRKLGEIMTCMVQEFYDTERIIRIAGSDVHGIERPLSYDQYQFMSLNKPIEAGIGPDGQPEVTGYENQIPPLSEAEFDVRVGPGSTLPMSKTYRFQQMLTLYSMQLVDDVEVLKNSTIPRWQDVLLRSREFWAQKMMAQAMAPAEGGESPEITDQEMQSELSKGAPPSEGGDFALEEGGI